MSVSSTSACLSLPVCERKAKHTQYYKMGHVQNIVRRGCRHRVCVYISGDLKHEMEQVRRADRSLKNVRARAEE